MAKIHEEHIVIKVSKLHKDNEHVDTIVSDDTTVSLEAIVQELVGADVVVEIIKE
jgi:hypothetical protein